MKTPLTFEPGRLLSPRLPRALKWQAGAAAAAALLLIAGCSTPVKLDQNAKPAAPVESRNPNGTAGANGSASGVGQSGVGTVDLTAKADTTAAPAADLPRVVYFDFDSYVVRDEYRNVIESNAKALSADRKKRVLIEGHTDERGGREYNLALGQRRAEAVARQLTLLGVQDAQLEPVSFGKERPAVQGNDESAWAKNRRAELKDR